MRNRRYRTRRAAPAIWWKYGHGKRTVTIAALVLLAIVGTLAVVFRSSVGPAVAAAAYVAPDPGETVAAERATQLTEQGDGLWAASQGYWPSKYVNRYFSLPVRTKEPSGEVARWLYCPNTPQVPEQCNPTSTPDHPYLIMSGTFDTSSGRYINTRLVGLGYMVDDKHDLVCTPPDSLDTATVLSDLNLVSQALTPAMRVDGANHEVRLAADKIWQCQSR
jgi:hypothetical protein